MHVPVFPVVHQRVPLGLLVQPGRAQLQDGLAEEIVRVVVPVVPHRDLQRALPQLRRPDPVVDERLVPPWIVRVRQRLRASLRLLAAFTAMNSVTGWFRNYTEGSTLTLELPDRSISYK